VWDYLFHLRRLSLEVAVCPLRQEFSSFVLLREGFYELWIDLLKGFSDDEIVLIV
jgi:hypothetical protein